MDFAPPRPNFAAMLRRFFLFMLVIGLSVPVLAPVPAMAAAAGEVAHCPSKDGASDHDAPEDRAAKHDCVGCIAPYYGENPSGLTVFARIALGH